MNVSCCQSMIFFFFLGGERYMAFWVFFKGGWKKEEKIGDAIVV